MPIQSLSGDNFSELQFHYLNNRQEMSRRHLSLQTSSLESNKMSEYFNGPNIINVS